MKVAITGGTGFIGRYLLSRCLAEGNEVRILSRGQVNLCSTRRVSWHEGDLNDPSSLLAFLDGVDVLYHCAGQITNQSQMRSLHVDGTANLIDAASGRVGHWVQLSSVGVYGPVSTGVITETSPFNPVGEYEITKAASDELVLAAAAQGRFDCAILRPSNVYGEDMNNQSLFNMIKMIERGLFFYIGKPGASANYIHVDNVVEGLVRCGSMATAKGGIYNLSDNIFMEEFVRVIVDALGCRLPTMRAAELPMRWIGKSMGKISGFPLTEARVNALTNRSIYPTRRIQEDLGYKHVMSMENGLRQLVAAYKNRAERNDETA